jgi:pyruvate/2-oxoglutarate dehydrogenase complex dihydrolipoamide dehydrogenase (E3) component
MGRACATPGFQVLVPSEWHTSDPGRGRRAPVALIESGAFGGTCLNRGRVLSRIEQASLLIQPLVQAASTGLGLAEMARGQYWIHPALGEVVANALLKLPLSGR